MRRVHATAHASMPTFTQLGSSLTEQSSAGYSRLSRGIELGRGDEAFQRASDGLRRWRAHRLIGMRVFPDDAAPRVGETVLVTLGTRRVAVAAPCRVVAVTDEPTRFGFSYATLPGHPECGEESFTVHRDD